MVIQKCQKCKHESKVALGGVDIRCRNCGGIFFILKAENEEEKKKLGGEQKEYIG